MKRRKKENSGDIRTLGSSGVERSYVHAVYDHADYESVRHAVLQRFYFLPIQKRHV